MVEYTYVTGYDIEVAGILNRWQKEYEIIEVIPLGSYIDGSQSAVFTVLVKRSKLTEPIDAEDYVWVN